MNHEATGSSLEPEDITATGPVKTVFVKKQKSIFGEQPLPIVEIAPRVLRYRTRRDLLFFGAGAVTAITGAGVLLPQSTLSRLGIHRDLGGLGKEWLLNRALRVDDDVAEALYSRHRRV